MRCSTSYYTQNNNLYLGTGFSLALSKSPSRLDMCGFSPGCPSTLIVGCAAEFRSQYVSTVTSTWLSGVGAEGHFDSVILASHF